VYDRLWFDLLASEHAENQEAGRHHSAATESSSLLAPASREAQHS
jgi:hypothetical protein